MGIATEPALILSRLQQRMELLGWDTAQLAAQSGVLYDTVYKIVSAKSARPRTSAEILGKFAVALRTSVDYLIGLTENPLPYGGRSLTPLQQEVLDHLVELPEWRQQEMLRMIRDVRRADAPPALKEEAQRLAEQRYNRLVLDLIERLAGQETVEALIEQLRTRPAPSGGGGHGAARAAPSGHPSDGPPGEPDTPVAVD